jgi:hypothetical protein
MALLTHATIRVTGDPLLLPAFRDQVSAALVADYANIVCQEMHSSDALHFDIKTSEGIPFPAFVAASENFPDLDVHAEWINPERQSRGSALIRAGRIAEQSADALADATRPHYVAVRASGELDVALVLFGFRDRARIGYAITATRDGLFRYEPAGDGTSAALYFSEGGEPIWDAAWQVDLAQGVALPIETWVALPIDEANYAAWRAHAEAFAAQWLWLEADAPEAIVVEQENFARIGVPVQPANLRYSKLKALRERATPQVSTLAEEDRLLIRVLSDCLAEVA